uniref:DNA-directed RNA polymerase n=1 Tax=Phacotus lenticularis TaxID=52965 RepID=A0A0S2LQB3_9CHLO|nr:beta subunit of RNA polymerase [Phacotus lenticularis]ALO63611.1 beta subunit of RNA polymerase [Phacotus lenticularis]
MIYNQKKNYITWAQPINKLVQKTFLPLSTNKADGHKKLNSYSTSLFQPPTGGKMKRYFLADFVEIQRKSFLFFLEKGLIEEFSKRNPINNVKKDLSFRFYPEYYKLTPPEYTPREAVLNSKSYTSKLYMPVQLTDKKNKIVKLKWIYIGNLPLMTKRGHFILNGAPRVVVNQIIRSPGIYYGEKFNENYSDKWSQKPENSYKRYYADLICLRGTWLRLEIDKDKNVWAQMKKGPKIPVFWFLIAMGIPERMIFRSVYEPQRLVHQLEKEEHENNNSTKVKKNRSLTSQGTAQTKRSTKHNYTYVKNPPEAWKEIYTLFSSKKTNPKGQKITELGRKWLFNKFMNPRTYDLGKQGRAAFNHKLGLKIAPNQLTLTGQDLLYATDYLIKVEKGLKKIDDIDHLKNRRVRTSGELLQIQIGIALVRFEKYLREKMNKLVVLTVPVSPLSNSANSQSLAKPKQINSPLHTQNFLGARNGKKALEASGQLDPQTQRVSGNKGWQSQPFEKKNKISITNIINSKPFNSAIREFFGTSPLSQFMDQINPLAEITHKRRLTSMGPGGVTRDNATLAIRGIHPTHYGRICPIETPEGKNTGLVNSMTAYARVNSNGIIESPFYKVYKGQVQKSLGMFYLSAEQEEKMTLAAADLFVSSIGFLPNANVPVRIGEDFTKIKRNDVQFIGISPLQMISIATSLIPFLEHDDANRALMGSNMQRQAVPLIRPERPIVGTGLEARAVSDSGHVLQAKYSGLVTYVSSTKIYVTKILK